MSIWLNESVQCRLSLDASFGLIECRFEAKLEKTEDWQLIAAGLFIVAVVELDAKPAGRARQRWKKTTSVPIAKKTLKSRLETGERPEELCTLDCHQSVSSLNRCGNPAMSSASSFFLFFLFFFFSHGQSEGLHSQVKVIPCQCHASAMSARSRSISGGLRLKIPTLAAL